MKKEELIKLIKYYDDMYYNHNISKISDEEYDKLKSKLKDYESVGAELNRGFKKVTHQHPVLSLDNVFEKPSLESFLNKVHKISPEEEFICEPKIDGLTIVLRYHNGYLISAATRGDGFNGEDVKDNIEKMNIPVSIKEKSDIELRGEVYMTKDDFITLNNSLKRADLFFENTAKLFSTPRHAASGSLKQLNPSVTHSRSLKYIIHGFADPKKFISMGLMTYQEVMRFIRSLGFIVSDNRLCKNMDEISSFYNQMSDSRINIPYNIDGVVIKANNLQTQIELGEYTRAPRYAIAYKFTNKQQESKIESIKLQVGRTGNITPVAYVMPIEIDNVKISKVTLHNNNEIEKKDIRVGDYIIIERSGDVIPKIATILYEKRDESVKPFIFPTTCPSCDKKLSIESNIYRCQDGLSCKMQRITWLEHFASRDALNISVIGVQNITTLYDNKLLYEIGDFFKLHQYKEKLIKFNGWGERFIKKLLDEIEFKRNTTLSRLIYSFGIPLIGRTAAVKLADFYQDVSLFVKAAIDSTISEEINGIGSQMAESIHKFVQENLSSIQNVINFVTIKEIQKSDSLFKDKKIIITGKFMQFSRDDIKNKILALGGILTTGSNADIILCGDKPGNKLNKLNKITSNTKIIYEEELGNLLKK